jgi:hypothetical protein
MPEKQDQIAKALAYLAVFRGAYALSTTLDRIRRSISEE